MLVYNYIYDYKIYLSHVIPSLPILILQYAIDGQQFRIGHIITNTPRIHDGSSVEILSKGVIK